MAIPPERNPELFERRPLDLWVEYSTTLNPDMRFETYKYAYPTIDPFTLITSELSLVGDETILDVGCSRGKLLESIREGGHTGQLIGLDIDEQLYISAMVKPIEISEPINFLVGDAEKIPLATSSVDVSTAMFMLYHCDPVRAIEELKRVTKPGGMIVISTSGPLNKALHRCFEELIALEVGASLPPLFNDAFDTYVANELLPQLFPGSNINHIPQEAVIALGNKPANQEQREAFETSLLTMKDSMVPLVKYAEWKVAMDKVWEFMDRQLTDEEYFEYVQRDYYFCPNDK